MTNLFTNHMYLLLFLVNAFALFCFLIRLDFPSDWFLSKVTVQDKNNKLVFFLLKNVLLLLKKVITLFLFCPNRRGCVINFNCPRETPVKKLAKLANKLLTNNGALDILPEGIIKYSHKLGSNKKRKVKTVEKSNVLMIVFGSQIQLEVLLHQSCNLCSQLTKPGDKNLSDKLSSLSELLFI